MNDLRTRKYAFLYFRVVQSFILLHKKLRFLFRFIGLSFSGFYPSENTLLYFRVRRSFIPLFKMLTHFTSLHLTTAHWVGFVTLTRHPSENTLWRQKKTLTEKRIFRRLKAEVTIAKPTTNGVQEAVAIVEKNPRK